jgi:superfamily II DNA or RNA helicase
MSVELTENLLSKAAGWEAMKRARAYLEQDQVLSSNWAPPVLKGLVQAGEVSFHAGLVIKGPIDIENICSCRESREWGTICAHSVAVGLHWLRSQKGEATPSPARVRSLASVPPSPARKTSGLLREADGEPAELFIILPPNFEQAAARGKVMLVLEAKWSGGRCPLNALPKLRPFAFSTQDSNLLDQLEALSNGETPAMLQIEMKDFVGLLPTLTDHPNVTLGKASEVTVTQTPLKLPLRATLERNGEIVLTLVSGVRPSPGAEPSERRAVSVRSSPPETQNASAPGDGRTPPLQLGNGWVWQNRTLQPLGIPPTMGDVIRGPVRVTRAQVPQFLSQHWPQLQTTGAIEANFKLEDFTLEPQAPKFFLELKGGLAQLTGLLQCAYGPRIIPFCSSRREEALINAKRGTRKAEGDQSLLTSAATNLDCWLPDPANPTRYSTRDFSAERAALARLQRAGFNGPDDFGKLQLNGQNAVLNFFAREYPKLEREWSVTLEERLSRRTAQNLERVEPKFQITPSGVQWFDLGVVFESSGGEKFSAADIQRLILSGQGHTRLKNGKTAVIDTGAVEELQEVLLDCSPQQHGQGYRISSTQAGFLESTLKQHAGWKVQAPAAWRDRASKQSGEARLKCPPLGDLESVLRPYQKHGVAWLQFLRENAFGGILADEMGLGKTLQVLAFFQSRLQRAAGILPAEERPDCRRDGNTLVVCPTSLVFNWVAEAQKFTPNLRVLALHGPERHSLFEQIPQSDVVVTSYALIRRDAEKYRDLEFDTVALDEAQHIKNRQTQNAQAVKAVRSRHRLVLTGTPMENSVLDLWSIFDFLMPGYLGAAQDFRERYELPITRDKNSDAAARLSRRLRPFILRRLKREVASDLPAKLEQVSFCEMTSDQRAVYQQVIEASRKEVLDAVGAQGLAKSRMVVLSALLRLRQVCCDLRLLKLERAGQEPGAPSGKLELFSELLEEVIDGGHRVLVFSQFVSMLTLLKEKLTAEGIEFCYLDGSTTNRGEVVEKFQKTTSIPVFLISLKAGGVGLNLTGADTVIHFDPWWNPAVEDQATDRAHRIGQTRVVTSYKLITRDTVEEKILLLQQKKRDIIKATLGSEEELAEALSWEDIQELLEV